LKEHRRGTLKGRREGQKTGTIGEGVLEGRFSAKKGGNSRKSRHKYKKGGKPGKD